MGSFTGSFDNTITNQKLVFYIFTVGNLQNIFMEHGSLLNAHFDPYSVFLAIATNIPQ